MNSLDILKIVQFKYPDAKMTCKNGVIDLWEMEGVEKPSKKDLTAWEKEYKNAMKAEKDKKEADKDVILEKLGFSTNEDKKAFLMFIKETAKSA